jgi:hypothetical protein
MSVQYRFVFLSTNPLLSIFSLCYPSSSQIRYIKKVWLRKNSPHAMVENSLEGDSQDLPMVVNPEIVQSRLDTVEKVRESLRSNCMYTNKAMFEFFCAGLESGMLKQSTRKLVPTPLRELITVAHEAHFRSEIWLALKHKRYRHQVTITWAHERRAIWVEFCKLVKEDRNNNEESASKTRLEELEGER